MIKSGVFIQNRYEIIGCIGSGGMAEVYKARDHKLNRFVAVKILKSEFREDKNFLPKFRAEAQAAAGLSHANIVSVYDVGEVNGTSFIVMELVEGITLKEYIVKKGKLSVREATSIALQVCAGLEAAHNNGIIHRDVKPQNIIISLDGKVKITDFGIARAASSNTINSVAMGSVHYSSPEQSRGGYSDAKSDIYSMGITMFEMLTGRLPFDGGSTVEIALKHLQDEIPSPRKYTPEIPFSTEQIILKCTQKSPDRRYTAMGEVIRDLKESLVNPTGNFVVIPSVDRSAHTVMLTESEMKQIKNGSMPSYDRTVQPGSVASRVENGTVSGDGRTDSYGGNYYQRSGYQDVRRTEPERARYPEKEDPRYKDSDRKRYQDDDRMHYADDYRYDDPDDDLMDSRERRRKAAKGRKSRESGVGERIVTVVSVLAAVVIGLIIMFLVGRSIGLIGGKTDSGTIGSSTSGGAAADGSGSDQSAGETAGNVVVPMIVGHTEEEARTMLNSMHLGATYQGEAASSDYPKGTVISQSVESGVSVSVNTQVGYTLSSGTEAVLKVPNLTNASQADAEVALTSMGLVVTADTTRYSDTIAEGNVITTNPGAGSSVKAGDPITVFVSQGAETLLVEVPEVEGHYAEDAQTALTNLGLYCYVNETASASVERGVVISQDIPAGSSVPTGTPVTITVSSGPDSSVISIIDDGSSVGSVWKCNAQLNAPDGYAGQPVRIQLIQDGITTTVFEGVTEFPYILNVEGQTGVPTGIAEVVLLDPSTYQELARYEYGGIVFSPVG